jgi:hypothetical protein
VSQKRQKADRQPGPLPEIRSANGNLTYTFSAIGPGAAGLTITWEPDGSLLASIKPAADGE